jgi:hypothetical protein
MICEDLQSFRSGDGNLTDSGNVGGGVDVRVIRDDIHGCNLRGGEHECACA